MLNTKTQSGWWTHLDTHTRTIMEAGKIGENYTGENVWPISPPAVCAHLKINPQPLLEQMNYCFVLCVQQHLCWCQKMTWFVFFFFFLCCSFFGRGISYYFEVQCVYAHQVTLSRCCLLMSEIRGDKREKDPGIHLRLPRVFIKNNVFWPLRSLHVVLMSAEIRFLQRSVI